MTEQSEAVRLIVERAQARLDAQLRDNDALDVTSLGLLAVDAAVLAVLIATHDALNNLWAIRAATLVAAGFFFLGAVWRRELDSDRTGVSSTRSTHGSPSRTSPVTCCPTS